jgi:hypothetical protein
MEVMGLVAGEPRPVPGVNDVLAGCLMCARAAELVHFGCAGFNGVAHTAACCLAYARPWKCITIDSKIMSDRIFTPIVGVFTLEIVVF